MLEDHVISGTIIRPSVALTVGHEIQNIGRIQFRKSETVTHVDYNAYVVVGIDSNHIKKKSKVTITRRKIIRETLRNLSTALGFQPRSFKLIS